MSQEPASLLAMKAASGLCRPEFLKRRNLWTHRTDGRTDSDVNAMFWDDDGKADPLKQSFEVSARSRYR